MNELPEDRTPSASPPSEPPPEPPPPLSSPPEEELAEGIGEEMREDAGQETGRPFPPTWALLLIVLGVLIVAGVGIAALVRPLTGDAEGGAAPQDVDKLLTFSSPPTLPSGTSLLQENGTNLPSIVPTALEIRDTAYPIVPVVLEEGRWPVPQEAGEVMVWVYGTVVNYVVGVPYTATTESLLAGLISTDQLTLTLSNGSELVFGSPQASRQAPDHVAPLNQDRPGLTLVLLGGQDEEERLIVRSRYLPEASAGSDVEQRVGALQVELLSSGPVGEGQNPVDYVVEYQVTNLGDDPIDPTAFDVALEDGEGQRYSLNPEASVLGEYGLPVEPIEPGTSVEASAGFRIPRELEPPLVWIFRPEPTAEGAARFPLAYEPPLPGPPQPEVSLTQAFVDQRRGVIVINGVVRNDGESPLAVTQDNISITSDAGPAELRAAVPNLPWSVAPGGEQAFELQFDRDEGEGETILLEIWGYTFEIEGLP
jgi:hypothetical protein